MANLITQTFTTMFIILFLLSHTTSSHSSSQEIQNPSSTTIPTHYHQDFYLKNRDSSTISLSKQERVKKRRIKRNKNMLKHRKKMIKNNNNMMQSSRPFSAMLPKGFVPPSGSSPCHNDQPNSLSSSFHCHISTTAQP